MYRQFLNYLWPDGLPSGTHLLLWQRKPLPTNPADGSRAQKTSYWCRSVSEAAQLLQRQVPYRDSDWYTGCGLSGRAYGAYARCKAPDIVALPGLWLDMDVCDGVHKKKNLPETQDQALEMLHAMPLPPSVVVHSGGGLQGWWLLDTLVHLVHPGVAPAHEPFIPHVLGATLSERWTRHLIVLCGKRGWTADSTFDLARVMRLPGTWNVKRGCGDLARPTSILGLCGSDGSVSDVPVRYSVETIMNALTSAEEKEGNAGLLGRHAGFHVSNPDGMQKEAGEFGIVDRAGSATPPAGDSPGETGRPREAGPQEVDGGGRSSHDSHPDIVRGESGSGEHPGAEGGDEPLPSEGLGGDGPTFCEIVDATLDNLCTLPRFEATWDRRRSFADNSLSTYDGALALFCVNAGVEDRVTCEIIKQFRLRHGQTPDERAKGSRHDYLDRTVRTAHEVKERDERERLARAEATAAAKLEKKVGKTVASELKKEVAADLREQGLVKPGRKTDKKRSSAVDRLLAEFQAAEIQGESEVQREALLREIGDRLGGRIESLVCYKADPSSYVLHVEGQEIPLGGIENLYSYHKFMLRVADVAGVFFPPKIDGWESIVRALHAIRLIRMVGEDGTDRGMLEAAVENYMAGLTILVGEDIARAVDRREPFVKAGEMYILLSALRESSRDLQVMSSKTVASALCQWGAEPKIVGYARAEAENIQRTTTRAYVLPNQEKWKRFANKKKTEAESEKPDKKSEAAG